MAKQPKPKTGNRVYNDSRSNKKANKKPGARKHQKNPQDSLALVLMGKGPYISIFNKKKVLS